MLPTFLYTLAGGMLLVLATGRMERIAWRFLRLISLIAFGLVACLTAWALQNRGNGIMSFSSPAVWTGAAGGASALLAAFLAPIALHRPRGFQGVCVLSGLTMLAAGCLSAIAGADPPPRNVTSTALIAVNQLFASALLGSITVSWLLGHAYLTATRMTIAPLRHYTRLLSWTVVLRIAFVAVSACLSYTFASGGQDPLLARVTRAWLIVSLRVALGLLAVGLFAYFVSDCVRLRSTQSATGILYFGSLFAYMGELAAQHFLFHYGWPI